MNLLIKNMSCLSCRIVVKYELEKVGITKIVVGFGQVEVLEPMSALQLENFKLALLSAEMELIEDPKSILVKKILMVIFDMINSPDKGFKFNFSHYLSAKLNMDYTYMANVFSESQGITIEKFIIQHKIDKVKQRICFDDLTQLSFELNYSSLAHLSAQFKKVTGITPSQYKQLNCKVAPALTV